MGKATAGHLSELDIDDGGGPISLAFQNASPSYSYDEEDATENGDSAEVNCQTIQRVSVDVDGIWHPGNTPPQDPGQEDLRDAFLNQTDLDTDWYPAGNVTTNELYQFIGHVSSLSFSDPASGLVTYSATIRSNDGLGVAFSAVP